MRCAFPTCDNNSSHSSSKGISFHRLPEDTSVCVAWMEVLGRTGWAPTPGSVVCSKHFLPEDFIETLTGRQLKTGAVPIIDEQMCKTCFVTDCKLYSMTSSETLNKAYEVLTGLSIADEVHLPQYLCGQCAERLMNCSRFRARSLRAHLTLKDIFNKHGCITVELVHSAIRSGSPLNTNPAPNIVDNHPDCGTGHEDLEEVYRLTDAGGKTKLEDVADDDIKTEIDDVMEDNLINSECRANNDTECSSTLRDTVVDEIKTENDDLSNQDDLDACSYNLNADMVVDNYLISQMKISECTLNLHEDIDVNNIVSESDTVDEDILLAVSNKNKVFSVSYLDDATSSTVGMVKDGSEDHESPTNMEDSQSFSFGVQTVLIEDPLPSQDKMQKATIAHRVQKETKAPKDLNQLKIENVIEQTSEADGELSADKRPYGTDSDMQLLEHLKARAAAVTYDGDVTSCKKQLQSHTWAHSRKQQSSCCVCKKSFSRKCDLQRHFRVHSGEKRYSCHICKKVFSQRSDLQSHLIIHSLRKTYHCNKCENCFIAKQPYKYM